MGNKNRKAPTLTKVLLRADKVHRGVWSTKERQLPKFILSISSIDYLQLFSLPWQRKCLAWLVIPKTQLSMSGGIISKNLPDIFKPQTNHSPGK